MHREARSYRQFSKLEAPPDRTSPGNAGNQSWPKIPSGIPMTNPFDEKKQLILANETTMARQLALHVIEKPVPRVWMIFIPVFFVFYFWKLKEYETSLKVFVENHLISRRRTLEAVVAAEESGLPVDIGQLVARIDIQEETRPLCAEWLTVLAGHFRLLLAAAGDSYPALVRSGYRNKSNYMLFYRKLGKAETAFNMALLPTIDGDSTDLCQVTDMMAEGMNDLRCREADEIFS
jgi:hypothetical protein